MGKWSRFAGYLGFGPDAHKGQDVETSTVLTFADIVNKYDVVSVEAGRGPSFGEGIQPYIIVAERPSGPVNPYPGNGMIASRQPGAIELADSSGADLREIGSAAPSPFISFTRREYNRDLAGLKGLEKFDQMRKSDATVRGGLRAYKTPVLAARWFMKPASSKKADINAAKITWCALTEYMSIPWTQFLTESLLMTDFGYYMFEKVWEWKTIEGKRVLSWKKLAPRHPMDVKEWHFDAHGGPAGVTMYPATSDSSQPDRDIPIKKLLVFTFDKEASNIEGISVLRSAYKSWYFKSQLEKIDAIQKERHGIGVPVIKLPVNYTAEDRAAAEELGRNLRTNERAHVVLPPNWDLFFAKLEGHIVNAVESMEYHDARIRENILANFLGDAKTTKEEDQIMFLKAARFTADNICDTINTYLIPQFINYNFSRVGYPKLQARRIGETEDQRTMSFTIRNLVGAKVIVPDRTLEDHVRDMLDIPPVDEESRDEYKGMLEGANKQRPDQAGLPRQADQPAAKPPAKNAGTDQSGKSSTK